MSIGELLGLYLAHHLHGRPSAPYYARLIRQVFPPLSTLAIESLDKLALLHWWTSLADRPGHANKAIGLLRAAHHWAVGLALIECPDPTAGIVKRPERTRSTTTSPDEWTMRPEHLYLDRDIPCWVKPTTKTGRPHIVPLPEQLVPMLRLLLRSNPSDAAWVFWGQDPSRVWCRTSAQKLWEGLRAKAGLQHLWLNDLRRSTASDLLNQGESLGIVQGALNHRSLSQTAKYAYLAVKPLAAALQERADVIVGRL